jgi:Asp-tRNA(Asn)/Glu-tRNA(Gln) amidotransferase C subunit
MHFAIPSLLKFPYSIYTAEGGMELLREDEIKDSTPVEEILSNTKGKLYHFIAVQKLMD